MPHPISWNGGASATAGDTFSHTEGEDSRFGHVPGGRLRDIGISIRAQARAALRECE